MSLLGGFDADRVVSALGEAGSRDRGGKLQLETQKQHTTAMCGLFDAR